LGNGLLGSYKSFCGIRDSAAQGQQREMKVILKETRVCARILQTSWHNPNVEPTAIWEEKVGRTVEITTLQSIGNIDS
jgi:hypothetical protein